MDTLVVIDIMTEPCLVFEKTSYKVMETDPTKTFCNIPVGVVLAEDIWSYIHVKLDEFTNHGKMLSLWIDKIMGNNLEVNPEFKNPS